MDAPPTPRHDRQDDDRSDTGITEWTLSNGATVVLKPTTLKENQILFRAFGAWRDVAGQRCRFHSARASPRCRPGRGVGPFSSVVLDKLLAGKALAVQPFIDEIHQGMRGGSTPQDLETMLQLIYLRFTQPRADPAAFAAMAAQAKALLANQLASPDVVFDQTIDAALSGNHPRRQPETPATVDQWDLTSRWRSTKRASPTPATSPSCSSAASRPTRIKPLVETYIASLPATHAHETVARSRRHRAAGASRRPIEKGIAPKSQVAIVLHGPFEFDDAAPAGASDGDAAAAVAPVRHDPSGARRHLQHHRDAGDAEVSEARIHVRIEWTCDPARTPRSCSACFDEIEFVRTAC